MLRSRTSKAGGHPHPETPRGLRSALRWSWKRELFRIFSVPQGKTLLAERPANKKSLANQ
jgi:hypothetical protein